MRFADDDVLLFASSKEHLQKCWANSRKVLKKWDSGFIQKRRKFSATKARTQKKIEVDNIKIEILTKGESARYLGQMITFLQQETTEIRNRISCLGDVSQVQTGTDIEKQPAQTSIPAIRRNDNSDDMLRIKNMDTHQRARKNDTIDATQNAPTHHTNEKKIQEDRETKIQDESEDGQSSNSHKDQDSDVSFENDTEEEVDTTEIEEEDWIEYIKRSTNDAMEKMENAKIRCWNNTHKK